MEYQLTIAVIGPTSVLPIDKERYEELKAARRVLTDAFAIEEKYEILLTNYIAFEQEILTTASHDMIRGTVGYSEFYESRRGFNVVLVNLLTAARLYVDQFPRHVRGCLGTGADGLNMARGLLNSEYDSSFYYRFMEALRNFVQHNSTPVHRVSIGGSREEDGTLEYGLAIVATKTFLEEDSDFKKAVLKECPDEVDLMVATRSYVGSLGQVNQAARDMIQGSVDMARKVVEAEREKYRSVCREKQKRLVGLEAQRVKKGQIVERIPLLLDWDDVRIELHSRNRNLKNLHDRYVSGKSRLKKNT